MQFLYQYPQFVQRLVLVDSGGLGKDVSIALRAVSLPGAEYVLPLVLNPRTLSSLTERDARAAFVHTARSVVDIGGQRVSGTDRFYLAARTPLRFAATLREFITATTGSSHAHEAWRQALLANSGPL